MIMFVMHMPDINEQIGRPKAGRFSLSTCGTNKMMMLLCSENETKKGMALEMPFFRRTPGAFRACTKNDNQVFLFHS